MNYAERRVADIAASLPGATQVFRRYKIDFCCGGQVPLSQAAAESGAALPALETELAGTYEEGEMRIERAGEPGDACPQGECEQLVRHHRDAHQPRCDGVFLDRFEGPPDTREPESPQHGEYHDQRRAEHAAVIIHRNAIRAIKRPPQYDQFGNPINRG